MSVPEWKRRMQTPVSNAEIAVHNELARQGLRPVSQQEFCLLSTKPDLFFPNENVAVYLDGEQVHKHPERDQDLRDKLKKRYGCRVLTYRYHAPLTKAKKKEIVDNIIDNLKGHRRDMSGF